MSGLIRKSQSAVFWNFSFSLFKDILQFGLALILVRILSPEAYGQFGLVSSIIGFLTVLSFRNFVAHTLQIRQDEKVDYQIHFTAGILIQVSIFIIGNLIALVLYQIKQYAEIAPILSIMTVLSLIDLPVELRNKMLERELEWKRLRLLNLVGALIYVTLALILAVSGAGVYALLIPNLFAPLPFVYDLFVIQKWRPEWHWSLERFSPAWRFGLTRMFSGMVLAGRQLIESSYLVLLVGYAYFGFYGRAISLSQLVCFKFAFLMMQAIYPVLTKIKEGSSTSSRAGGLVLRSVGWIVIPTAMLLSIWAGPIIKIIYGPQWTEVINLFPWALVAGAAGAIAYVTYMLLLANQQERHCFLSDMCQLLGTIVSLVCLAPRGVSVYLIGTATIQVVVIIMNATWLYRAKGISFSGIIGATGGPLLSTAIAYILCRGILHYLGEHHDFIVAFSYLVCFCVIYASLLRLLFSSDLRELLGCLPGGGKVNRLLLLNA